MHHMIPDPAPGARQATRSWWGRVLARRRWTRAVAHVQPGDVVTATRTCPGWVTATNGKADRNIWEPGHLMFGDFRLCQPIPVTWPTPGVLTLEHGSESFPLPQQPGISTERLLDLHIGAALSVWWHPVPGVRCVVIGRLLSRPDPDHVLVGYDDRSPVPHGDAGVPVPIRHVKAVVHHTTHGAVR